MNALDLRIPRFVDRDMFMRFRGGGVGHKSMRTEMCCLLDDRDELDERDFKKEKEQSKSRSELETTEEDEDMIDEDEDDRDDEEDGDDDGDTEDEDGEDGEEVEDDLEGGEEGDEEEVPAATPFEVYVDDEVADEMDEYGYSGLDQVVNEDDESEEIEDDENAFGPEDGEDVVHEFEE